MKPTELRAMAPVQYVRKVGEYEVPELWANYKILKGWWGKILTGTTSVGGWGASEIRKASELTRRWLRKRAPQEYILKQYFKQGLLLEPGEVPGIDELENPKMGLDYGFRERTAGELVGWKGGILYVIHEFYVTKHSVADIIKILKEWGAEIPVVVGRDRPSLIEGLEEAGLNVEVTHGNVADRVNALEEIFREEKIKITQEAKGLRKEIPEYRRIVEDGIVTLEPKKKMDDALDGLGYAVLSYKKKKEKASESIGNELMPTRPSGEDRGREITCEEVLEHIKPFKIRSDIMRLTGGVVNNGKTVNDLEVYIEKLTWEELLRILTFRLYRGLPKELASRFSFLRDHTGGTFTSNIPLGDLMFVPKPEFVRIAMGVAEELRAAPEKIKKECEESEEEDRIRIGRMFYLLKPWRGAYEGERQTIENFVNLFSEEDFPRYTSKKMDGNTFVIFKNGNEIRIYSDDGLLNENMPNVEERVKKLPNSSVVLLTEIELWRNGVHYPREAVRAVMAGARPEWLDDLIVNVFEVPYWNGRDIHKLEADKRLAFYRDLDVDQETEKVPEHGKLLNRVPQHVTSDKKELKAQTERLSGLPGSEGVVSKRGPWLLKRRAKIDASAKYHKAGWIKAVVIDQHETKTDGVYTYSYGLTFEEQELDAEEPAEVNGQQLATVGRTFNTSQELSPGDLIEVEFETLNFIEDLDKKTFKISGWIPELLWEIEEGKPNTVSEAIEIAKENGVYQPKWVQDGETLYDGKLVKAKETGVIESFPEVWFPGTRGEIEEKSARHQYHSSLLLKARDGTTLLIDKGEEAAPNLQADFYLLTHAHIDHVGGFKKGTSVWMSARSAESMAVKSKELDSFVFDEKERFSLGPFEITGIPVLHSILEPMTIYRVDFDGASMIYAPDVASVAKADREKFFGGVKLYIGDGSRYEGTIRRKDETIYGHAPWKTQCSWAKQAGIPTMCFTHFGKGYVEADKEQREKWRETLTESYGVRVVYAEDGMELQAELIEVEELELEKFKARGMDEDMKHVETNWRECLADLRYLGNFAYPRFMKGEGWGAWTLDDVERYFAKLINVLRGKARFTLVPPGPDDESYDTAYWKLYRTVERKGMIEVAPPEDAREAAIWDKERKEIIVTDSGSKGPGIVHSPEFREQFSGKDPYLQYPEHGKEMRMMRHAHFRGASVHFDARRQVTEDYLVGWTENVQKEGTIKEPILTMKDARKICEGYSITGGNKYLKPLVPTGGKEEKFGGHVVLEEKSPEPLAWIEYDGVAPAGSVGATAMFPGVFYIMDRGFTEYGTQKNYYHEYFDYGGEIFNGIYVCRLLKNVWGPELTGTAKMVWFGWFDQSPVPYVLTPRSVEKKWYPPTGQSALPGRLEEHVPEKLRYWEKPPSQARMLRDKLVKEKIFTEKTLGFNEKNELVWVGE